MVRRPFLKSVEPALTYADIKALLLANVDPVTMPAGKETVTNGRLNLHKAVRNIDYDKDGLILEDELTTGANPHKPDTDGDGLPDGQEYHDIGTDPTLADSDKDGLPDKWEYDNDLDPLDDQGVNGAGGDPDGDGKTNLEEYQDGTNPRPASHRTSTVTVKRTPWTFSSSSTARWAQTGGQC